MMATTVAEIGSVYCSVVSFANTRGSYEMDRGAVLQSLIAIRLKLKRSLILRTNIVYEVRCVPARPDTPAQTLCSFKLFSFDLVFTTRTLAGTAVSEDP